MSKLEAGRVITPSEANDLIVEEDPVVLDVRTPSEFAEGHIEGAVSLPLDELSKATVLDIVEDTNKQILLYCTSGRRSGAAGAKLARAGFSRVYELVGGINAWPFGTVS